MKETNELTKNMRNEMYQYAGYSFEHVEILFAAEREAEEKRIAIETAEAEVSELEGTLAATTETFQGTTAELLKVAEAINAGSEAPALTAPGS